VLAGDGTDDLARELTDVILVLPLLVGEGEVHSGGLLAVEPG
jgi:hypothetical protein